jgi:hypothetical protein
MAEFVDPEERPDYVSSTEEPEQKPEQKIEVKTPEEDTSK